MGKDQRDPPERFQQHCQWGSKTIQRYSRTSYSTWRNTNIKTGNQTIKIKLANNIPGRVRYTAYGWISYRYKKTARGLLSM